MCLFIHINLHFDAINFVKNLWYFDNKQQKKKENLSNLNKCQTYWESALFMVFIAINILILFAYKPHYDDKENIKLNFIDTIQVYEILIFSLKVMGHSIYFWLWLINIDIIN